MECPGTRSRRSTCSRSPPAPGPGARQGTARARHRCRRGSTAYLTCAPSSASSTGHGKLALISIGGSTNPNWFYPCSRAHVGAFAHNLVRYMRSNGFDGIDLDIEQDAGTGKPALTAADLRACTRAVQRDAKAVKTRLGRVPLITSDVDPTTDFDIGKIQNRYIDQFNAMSYGAGGSALASQISDLERSSGIPASRITAGLDIDDYPPPRSDCAATAGYAASHHLAGAMLWFGQADAPTYSCLAAIAPFVP